MSATDLWTPGRTLHALAAQEPNAAAVYLLHQDGRVSTYTRRELDRQSSRLAHALAARGVCQHQRIAIHLHNSFEHVLVTLAAYKLGACPTPVSARLPKVERDALLGLVDAAAIFSDDADLDAIRTADLHDLVAWPDTLPPDRISQPAKAIASGGSTGKPKLIVSPGAFAFPWQGHPLAPVLDFRPGDLVFSPGPLFHNQAFFFSQIALFQGAAIALNERFNAEQALTFIERHQPTVLNMVPTMMQRMLRTEGLAQRDLSSIRKLWHLAAPCPDWAKLGWIDRIGADRVWELWAATEITGLTTISGTDWLSHRGSVGTGFMTDIKILDPDGRERAIGEVGEVFSRFGDGAAQYAYVGAPPLAEHGDGYRSVGDLGHVDGHGYLYLADRRTDLIISGGSNVYPAEVEAVISAHPLVRDVAVVGLPDDDLGRRVHAVVETRDPSLTAEQLRTRCAESLVKYKVPRSFEFVEALPRNEAGKIRRSALMPRTESTTP